MLERLAVNARKLDRLLSDLLDLDRLSRGIVEPRRRLTDIGALVRRVTAESGLLADRQVSIEAEEVVLRIEGNAVSAGTVVLVALLLIFGSQFTLFAMWFDMESNKDLR